MAAGKLVKITTYGNHDFLICPESICDRNVDIHTSLLLYAARNLFIAQ
ncbi:hypothetical protein [Chroogloeocystis siderophila]|nr:hypothetical protein [Chroogloeocystis siderophila]